MHYSAKLIDTIVVLTVVNNSDKNEHLSGLDCSKTFKGVTVSFFNL